MCDILPGQALQENVILQSFSPLCGLPTCGYQHAGSVDNRRESKARGPGSSLLRRFPLLRILVRNQFYIKSGAQV